VRKAFTYKARVNKQADANALRWLELCRSLYNVALEQRITAYKRCGKTLSGYTQCYELPELKEAFPEFQDVGSQVLQEVLERLDRAYQGFFRRLKAKQKAGFPRFRGRDRYDSFTLKQCGWILDQNVLSVKNVGVFRLRLSRPIEGTIKTVTIRRSRTGAWFVSFSCDGVTPKLLSPNDKAVGIDVGLKVFCADSDGNTIQNPRFFRHSEKLLRKRQRSLSRKVRGSTRRRKARVLVAKVHERVANQRNDWLHKRANYYIRHYGTVCVEDLNIRSMVRNRYLAKSISDASWGKFLRLLSVKAEEAARTVIAGSPRNTSQNCSNCGKRVPKALSVRVHRCPHCGLVRDRDVNAAINVLKAGQTFQARTLALAGVA
jgi:putative transposase